MTQSRQRPRRRDRKSVPKGNAYIASTFNNTIITLTDLEGNAIASGSAGMVGFKGARKKDQDIDCKFNIYFHKILNLRKISMINKLKISK